MTKAQLIELAPYVMFGFGMFVAVMAPPLMYLYDVWAMNRESRKRRRGGGMLE